MRVKWVGYKGDNLLALVDRGFTTLEICRDVPCPYGFVLDEMRDKVELYGAKTYDTDLKEHLNKRRVARFETRKPKDVAGIRDKVGYNVTFECDIPYIRRLFVDRVLESGWDNIFVWLDIEVDDSKGFPKPDRSEIVSIAYSLDGVNVDFLHKDDFSGEKELLKRFRSLLEKNGRAIAVGWNVGFDLEFLKTRGGIDWLSPFDLMSEYKGVVKGLEYYNLDYISKYEGLGGKTTTKRIYEMSKQELMEYNTNDVKLVLEIDKKYGFTKLRAKLGELVGLLNDDLTPVRIGDTLILRRARELGYVLSNTVRVSKKGYQGAVVLEPLRKGLVKNVAVLDYESLYPNVIVNEKIDIPGFNGEIMPYIEANLLKLRKEAKKKFKETGDSRYDIEQWAFKILANSLYGLFGTEGFRFFNEEIASRVTGKGREMILKAKEAIESLGYTVVYGDSVSGDTQIYYITLGGVPRVATIEELFNRYKKYARVRPDGKEEVYVKHLHMLTPSIDTKTGNVGLGEIVRIIRHRVTKPMCEVVTETGKRVKVTTDHSLIAFDKREGVYKEISCWDLIIDTDKYLLVSLSGEMLALWGRSEVSSSTSLPETSRHNNGQVLRDVRDIERGEEEANGWERGEGDGLEQGIDKGIDNPEIWGRVLREVEEKEIGVSEKVLRNASRGDREVEASWNGDHREAEGPEDFAIREDVVYGFEGVWQNKELYGLPPGAIHGVHHPGYHGENWLTPTPNIRGWVLLPLLSDLRILSPKIRDSAKELGARPRSRGEIEEVRGKLYEGMGARDSERVVEDSGIAPGANRESEERGAGSGEVVRFERVVEVKQIETEESFVYDLEVDGYHTFLANGLFVHNTDSLFITGWRDDSDLAFMVESINELIKPYVMKLEYTGDLYITAKKRYILRTKDGKEIVKGMELVRSDWSPLFKKIVKDIVDMMFQGKGKKEIHEYLAELRMKLWRGELDKELIVCKGVSNREYKVDSEHVRAAKKWVKKTNTPLEYINRICYYYVKNKDGVEPVDPSNPVMSIKPDYQRYWDRIVIILKRLLVFSS